MGLTRLAFIIGAILARAATAHAQAIQDPRAVSRIVPRGASKAEHSRGKGFPNPLPSGFAFSPQDEKTPQADHAIRFTSALPPPDAKTIRPEPISSVFLRRRAQ